MEKTFEYIRVQTALDTFNVQDIGNVILQACNDMGFEWYLSISTECGMSTIKEFGPLFKDNTEAAKYGFSYYISKIEYSEKKLCKIINNFLNNPSSEITQVQEINDCELQNKIVLAKRIL